MTGDDLSCYALAPADHLLFLAFHNVFPRGAVRLDWIVDTAFVMVQLCDAEAWQRIIERAVGHHIRVPLELTLTSAELWAGHGDHITLPVLSTWPAPGDREQHLWKYAATRHSSVFSGFHLALQGQPGIVEKFRYGCRYILPPTPMMARFRRSTSPADLPLAHLRRWGSILKYI
ncbi:MAG: nucleotidyltransferase family protein [Methanospirillum sp.]